MASEILDIMDICSSVPAQDSEDHVSEQQVKEAIESVNKGKAADFHGVTVDHFLNGGPALLQKVREIINSVFRFGRVTKSLSIGTLTPVFKNRDQAQTLRTIEVLQFIKTFLRDRIQPSIEAIQNSQQRGFKPPVTSAAVCSAVVYLLFMFIVDPIFFCCGFMFGSCFVNQYFATFLVLQSYRYGSESWLLDIYCL